MNINQSSTSAIPQSQNDTSSKLNWDQLKPKEWEIFVAVIVKRSPEEARKSMDLSRSSFYRIWKRVKPYHDEILREGARKAKEILVSQAVRAAQIIAEQLYSNDAKLRFKAAIEVLNRTIPKESLEDRIKRDISFEEFCGFYENKKDDLDTGYKPAAVLVNQNEIIESSNQDNIEAIQIQELSQGDQQPEPVYDNSWKEDLAPKEVWQHVDSYGMLDLTKEEHLELLSKIKEYKAFNPNSPADLLETENLLIQKAQQFGYSI